MELRAVLAGAMALAGAGFVATRAARAEDAASKPSATQPDRQSVVIGQWVRELADGDPDVRDRARVKLMGLDRAGLEVLRQVVAANGPLGPGQVVALREIVNHAYLAAYKDEAPEGAGGFLGVHLAPAGVEVVPAPGVRPDSGQQVGIAVAGRVPGFCGYRMLEDGDVILRLTSDKTVEFHNTAELIATVGQQRPGEQITLDVLRRGKLIHVPITLDRKPAWVGQAAMGGDALGPRQRRAAEYWDEAFAPLLEGRATS